MIFAKFVPTELLFKSNFETIYIPLFRISPSIKVTLNSQHKKLVLKELKESRHASRAARVRLVFRSPEFDVSLYLHAKIRFACFRLPDLRSSIRVNSDL